MAGLDGWARKMGAVLVFLSICVALRKPLSARLPDLTVLDDLMYKAIALGFAFFTIATILGAFWAAEAWGGYWSWDPKETWALIVWLNYAAWLHMRLMKGLRGAMSAWWALLGLLVTTFAFLGVNMFLSACTATAPCKRGFRGGSKLCSPGPTDGSVLHRKQAAMHFHPDRGHGRKLESDVTPRSLYASRRELLALGAGALLLPNLAQAQGAKLAATKSAVAGAQVMDKPTRYEDATRYNNFYEFGTDKSEPARNAHTLKTSPWSVIVEGECAKPGRFDLEALLKLSPMEERIYRLRCVEGWSMVIPWIGYSLAELIKRVEPNSRAKFVEFTTLADKSQMPELGNGALDWPYVEGLRIDEAMHPLSLLAFGMLARSCPSRTARRCAW